LPFRGEYYYLAKTKSSLINGLVYPVPDPKFPFLGVHLTKTVQGTVEAGPNAVLALSREGHRRLNVSFRDCYDILSSPGFWKMARRYWKVGLYETYRSFSKKAFLKDLKRLVPSLAMEDLTTGGCGIRAQLVRSDGSMVDDFAIETRPRMIHVLNAPSPAATASISIGEHLSNLAHQVFEL
ncbi:MAG: FAD-dependent oxidoreductase, partial [Waddliaceae bacterium]